MTEEMISTVSKIPTLISNFQNFCDEVQKFEENCNGNRKELNVGKILEGSVRKSGNKLRITTQLIDSISDVHLWNQSYDKESKTFSLFRARLPSE